MVARAGLEHGGGTLRHGGVIAVARLIVLRAALVYHVGVLPRMGGLSAGPLRAPGFALRFGGKRLYLVVLQLLVLCGRSAVIGALQTGEEAGAAQRIEARMPRGQHAEGVGLPLVVAAVAVVQRLAERHGARAAIATFDLPVDGGDVGEGCRQVLAASEVVFEDGMVDFMADDDGQLVVAPDCQFESVSQHAAHRVDSTVP
jgi:hypothetical protein